jgi:regulator of sigma E protease
VAGRGYYRQPVWKRIVVIGAGPAVNIVLAFVILFFVAFSFPEPDGTVKAVDSGSPAAAAALKPGDRLVSINGKRFAGTGREERVARFAKIISADKCRAADPVEAGDGRLRTTTVYPVYDKSNKRMRIGIEWGSVPAAGTPRAAASFAWDKMWMVASGTFHVFSHIFESEERKQISGIVGTSDVAHQTIDLGAAPALFLLAIVSLSLGLINLLPILPLDGGHIFWSLVEKFRGEPVSMRVIERATVLGFVLVAALMFIGLNNDIGRLTGEGFGAR